MNIDYFLQSVIVIFLGLVGLHFGHNRLSYTDPVLRFLLYPLPLVLQVAQCCNSSK